MSISEFLEENKRWDNSYKQIDLTHWNVSKDNDFKILECNVSCRYSDGIRINTIAENNDKKYMINEYFSIDKEHQVMSIYEVEKLNNEYMETYLIDLYNEDYNDNVCQKIALDYMNCSLNIIEDFIFNVNLPFCYSMDIVISVLDKYFKISLTEYEDKVEIENIDRVYKTKVQKEEFI